MHQVCRIGAGALALAIAAPFAHGAVTGVSWGLVNNSVSPWPPNAAPGSDPVAGAAWNDLGGAYTFDLFVNGAPGNTINGINFGGDGNPNFGLIVTGGTVFNHPLGGNARSFSTEPLFPALPFDTFATFGGDATTAGQATQFAGPVNMNGPRLTFTSFTQPPIAIPNSGRLWVLRITVSGSTRALFGNIQVGTSGGVVLDFIVPDAFFPSPGPVALFGLAGLASARRRRGAGVGVRA